MMSANSQVARLSWALCLQAPAEIDLFPTTLTKHEFRPFLDFYNSEHVWVSHNLLKISVRQRWFIPQGCSSPQMEPGGASFLQPAAAIRPGLVPGPAPYPAQLLFSSSRCFCVPILLPSLPSRLPLRGKKNPLLLLLSLGSQPSPSPQPGIFLEQRQFCP